MHTLRLSGIIVRLPGVVLRGLVRSVRGGSENSGEPDWPLLDRVVARLAQLPWEGMTGSVRTRKVTGAVRSVRFLFRPVAKFSFVATEVSDGFSWEKEEVFYIYDIPVSILGSLEAGGPIRDVGVEASPPRAASVAGASGTVPEPVSGGPVPGASPIPGALPPGGPACTGADALSGGPSSSGLPPCSAPIPGGTGSTGTLPGSDEPVPTGKLPPRPRQEYFARRSRTSSRRARGVEGRLPERHGVPPSGLYHPPGPASHSLGALPVVDAAPVRLSATEVAILGHLVWRIGVAEVPWDRVGRGGGGRALGAALYRLLGDARDQIGRALDEPDPPMMTICGDAMARLWSMDVVCAGCLREVGRWESAAANAPQKLDPRSPQGSGHAPPRGSAL